MTPTEKANFHHNSGLTVWAHYHEQSKQDEYTLARWELAHFVAVAR